MQLLEGGNAIPDAIDVPKQYVPQVVADAKSQLPQELLAGLQTDIGSAGYKVQSGDIDLMVDAAAVVKLFNTGEDKDPVKAAKKALEAYFQKKGLTSVTKGSNVHIGIPFDLGVAQVDVMVINDAAVVAPWHQHGPRGSYDDPDFKGNAIFMLMNSIGKAVIDPERWPAGLKFDAWGAKLMRRDNNQVVARTRDEAAQILFNPNPPEGGDVFNSVKSMMRALAKDPDANAKLAQARDDAKKGLITLHEPVTEGTTSWFRQMHNILVK